MNFEIGNIYHVYNQGNNRRIVFHSRNHYEYFIKKIRLYILPYADILAWCLMPNHFHLLIYVRNIHVSYMLGQDFKILLNRGENITQGITNSRTLSIPEVKNIILNDSIGIMLRSYTRAVNKEKGWSGSIFRKYTKAINLTSQDGITPAWFTENGITKIQVEGPQEQYLQICFDYIHNNPVRHEYAYHPEDWKYSSYGDYSCKGRISIVNKTLADEFGLNIQ